MCNIDFGIFYVRRFFTITVILLFLIKNGAGEFPTNMGFDLSIYYEPTTHKVLQVETAAGKKLPEYPLRYFTSGLKCDCVELNCGCCAGINITQFNFDHVMCANFTVVPEALALDLQVNHDGSNLLTRRVSGSNPEPVCVPFAYFPMLSFCVRFYDLGVQDNKFKVCINFEVKIASWTIIIMRFSCVTINGDGISWVKPWMNQYDKPPNVDENDILRRNIDLQDAKYAPFFPLITIRVLPEEDKKGWP